ncbi:MAG: hypothetical protein WKF95_13965 [Rubrobacter sp.]
MMTGRVTDDGREAVITLQLSAPGPRENGRSADVRAIIDSGFTDWLFVPTVVAEQLDLPFRGSVEAELADGRIERLPIHRVRVLWHGRTRSVRAYAASAGEALIGMSLLSGSRLTVNAEPGGDVRIEEF